MMIDDVETTPFTLLVAILPAVAKELDEITEVVAVTPLIILVRVFPVTD